MPPARCGPPLDETGDLIRHLERCGCVFDHEGKRHTIFKNPANGKRTTIPRHMEIDNRLARIICKQLGIPLVS
ncbi:MAG TPA: type II toxin-antitoxin system HicA family toxin [Terriglobia bacterium]|nr:type II toxin-antitoxin system HicA family toxin [Terriglobia bacterium]